MSKFERVETRIISLILLIALGRTQAQLASSSGKLYSVFAGIDVDSPCLRVISDVSSVSSCASLCRVHDPPCLSGSYHAARRTCCLCDVRTFYDNVTFHEDQQSWFFQEPGLNWDIVHQGWTLVFRATAGTGTSFYSVWNDTGRHDDRPLGNTDLQLGCMTLNGQNPCRSHFRSHLLDMWSSLGVQQVSIRMYQNGVEKTNVIFNGSGSDVKSWMTPSRLLKTPWVDATPSTVYNFFGVDGHSDYGRHFFINQHYDTCPLDRGWMAAVDVISASCAWEVQPGYKPLFLHSATTTSIVYESSPEELVLDDVMAVFILY